MRKWRKLYREKNPGLLIGIGHKEQIINLRIQQEHIVEYYKDLNPPLWLNVLGWHDLEIEIYLIEREHMTPTEYINRAIALESNDYNAIAERTGKKLRLMHALIGINTENGELQDQFKKHIFYGKTLDRINVKEELGDLMWYIALACDEMGFTLEDVMTTNITKLEFRYKDKQFKETQALNRDLTKERQILET